MGRSARIAVAGMVVMALTIAAQAGARPSPEPATQVALKKCKKGLNAKRCACPKGKKLARKGRKYHCVKKAVTKTPTTPTPVTTTPPPAPPAAPDSRPTFTTFMEGSTLTDEYHDRTGTSSHKYVYTFCKGGIFRYTAEDLSYTADGSSVTNSQGEGSWSVADAAVSDDKTEAKGQIKVSFGSFQTNGAPAEASPTLLDFMVTLVSRPTFVQSWVNDTPVERTASGC